MTPLEHIGIMIKSMRGYRGLTQIELAEKLGVSQPFVSQFEAGDKNATVEMLVRVAEALDCVLNVRLTPLKRKAKD